MESTNKCLNNIDNLDEWGVYGNAFVRQKFGEEEAMLLAEDYYYFLKTKGVSLKLTRTD